MDVQRPGCKIGGQYHCIHSIEFSQLCIHVEKHGIHISINAYAIDNIHILNMSVNIALLVWLFVVLPLVSF